MKFEDWKDEKNLNLVCDKLLNNADMDYSFSDCPLSLDFVFYVVGSDIKVLFSCSEICQINIEKEYDDVPLHLVLEVNVRKEDGHFYVQIMPEFNLELECMKFEWSLQELSNKERLEIYPNE